MERKKRERYIDAARGIGIALVVLGHVIITEGYTSGSVTKFIYSFHMPLFFFLSGWCRALGGSASGRGGLAHLWKTVKKLFVPYFIWSFIYLCLAYIGGPVDWEERLQAVFTFRGIAPLWFLPALGLCEGALYLALAVRRHISRRIQPVLLPVLCILMYAVAYGMYQYYNSPGFPAADMVPVYLYITAGRFFVSFAVVISGYLVCRLMSLELFEKRGNLFYFVSGVVMLVLCFAAAEYTGLSVNMHLFVADKPGWFFFTAMAGSAGLVFLCRGGVRFLSVFSVLGVSSLGIMILHYQPFPFMHLAVNLMKKITGIPAVQIVAATVIVLAVSLAGTWVCSCGCFITNNNRVLKRDQGDDLKTVR